MQPLLSKTFDFIKGGQDYETTQMTNITILSSAYENILGLAIRNKLKTSLMFNTHLSLFQRVLHSPLMLQSPCNLMIKGGLIGVQGLDHCVGAQQFLQSICGQNTNLLQSLDEKGRIGGEGSSSHTIFPYQMPQKGYLLW